MDGLAHDEDVPELQVAEATQVLVVVARHQRDHTARLRLGQDGAVLPRHYFHPARQSAPDRDGAGRSAASPPRTPTWVGSRKVALITGGNLGRTVRGVRADVSTFGDLDQLPGQIKREPGSLQQRPRAARSRAMPADVPFQCETRASSPLSANPPGRSAHHKGRGVDRT